MKPQQMKISLVLPTIRTDAEFSCEDFMDLEGASGQRSDQSGKRRVSRGTEHPAPAEHDEAAPGSGDDGACANDAPTPPQAPVEGSQAEAGPGEGAALRRPPPRMKNEASMRECQCLCA